MYIARDPIKENYKSEIYVTIHISQNINWTLPYEKNSTENDNLNKRGIAVMIICPNGGLNY